MVFLGGTLFFLWGKNNKSNQIIIKEEQSKVKKIEKYEKINPFINCRWKTDYCQVENGHIYWLRMMKNGLFVIYKDNKIQVGYFDLNNTDNNKKDYEEYEEEYELVGMVKHKKTYYVLVEHEDIDSTYVLKYYVAKINLKKHDLEILFDVTDAHIDTGDRYLPGYFVGDYFCYDIRNGLKSRNRTKNKPVIRHLKKDSSIEKNIVEIDEKKFIKTSNSKCLENDDYRIVKKSEGICIWDKHTLKNTNIKKKDIVSMYLTEIGLFYRVRNRKLYEEVLKICEEPDTYDTDIYFDSMYVYYFDKKKVEKLY